MMKTFLIVSILFSFLPFTVPAQTNSLRRGIEQIIASKKATVGVAIYGLESKDTVSINGNIHYPMQSVFKFHIALAVLNEVDKGKLSLNTIIFTKKTDLLANMWSPIADKYPNQDIKLPVDSLLGYTVSQSDNNGCDILLKLLGGPATVNNYIHSIGIKGISIMASEGEMHKEWNVQFTNWTTALSATQLLTLFFNRKILSQSSYSFLWKIMTETSTGPKRIKGQLPPGTLVAHKTGTSATNEKGITAAVNDIGIVTLPNGTHFAISVFVSNSTENEEANEKMIADITKLAWDYFVSRLK
jgi:beta-lactamase class A